VTQTANETALVYSDLGQDPDLCDLVELFVEEMPGRIGALLELAEHRDWEGLARIAHQLKGAAGSYGFHAVTPLARRLELAARAGSPQEREILDALNDTVSLCRRCRAAASG
jgi:HPt (histidine-containing phosphotransfer) domain-containing protein